ncbi:MAG TPA: hypothetical protein VFY03_06270 [Woeseiaceae bacterium]|nr:hypothetical protein [Woeseiaceae bacterium]
MPKAIRKATSAPVAAAAALCSAGAWADAPAGSGPAAAGAFAEDFDGDRLRPGWSWQAGDGDAEVTLGAEAGIGSIEVDATADRRNIWWAFIRHPVTPAIDVAALAANGLELRVEARVRTDTAPRRINLHLNHSRTTDFHSHLMEFDLPAAGTWYDVSMTTRGFDAGPGDEVFVQLALMDWGRRTYRLDVDHIRVRAVDPAVADADVGRPLPYRPDAASPVSFMHAVRASSAATVTRPARDAAANTDPADPADSAELALDSTQLVAAPAQMIVLRWDFGGIDGRGVPGFGLLALSTLTVRDRPSQLEACDELRVQEILADDAAAAATDAGWSPLRVNEQPVIDVRPAAAGTMTVVPLSPPVLERLLAGRSRGLAIGSHGCVRAGFAAAGDGMPTLYFDTMPATAEDEARTLPEEMNPP